ncbi:MAG TPA: DUF1269 domain-containing protein [Gammaproteobacteria bacterium]|nr:DUF1269 domain-containing protein [Gammaproteobacteria bacterium]
MRRLYFLVPDVETARAIHNKLLLARIGEEHIHVIARAGIPLEDLPEATLAQQSDLIPALERGTAAGGVTGMIAGIVVLAFPPAGFALGGAAILAFGLAGAGFGALMSTMVGIGLPSSRLKKYSDSIDKGELLMMVDIPKDRIVEIDTLVKQHHPDAEIAGTEPHIPAFP